MHPTRRGYIDIQGLQAYNESDQVRYLEGRAILPIGYIPAERDKKGKRQTPNPTSRARIANIYTREGVKWLGEKINVSVSAIQKYMLEHPILNRSLEYNDNRISLVSGQKGKDLITGKPLVEGRIACHHIQPISDGGDDSYKNLILVDERVHKLIHMTDEEKITGYVRELEIDSKQLKKLNKYRKLAGNFEITINLEFV